MLNIAETAKRAASEFGLSMKDDPTIWPAGSEITPEIVRKTCNAAALENARSALSRARGKIAETVATEMDVEIADNGPGIPEDVLPHIFQPRFSTTASRGLGLHIVETIVAEHDGEVLAANREDGQGARFTIRVPAERVRRASA